MWAISALYVGQETDPRYRDYQPPALEFEQMALSAMLCLNREATTQGMARLHPRHFRWKHHRWIFEAITKLEHRRQMDSRLSAVLRSIDAVSVWGEMDAAGHGRGEGWESTPLSYVLTLPGLCPSPSNIDYYIDRVVEFSTRRHLWELAQILKAACERPDADGARLLAAVANAQQHIAEFGWCDWRSIFGETK